MSKKIAFFDIDGTLLNHQKKLQDETIQAVKELQRSGVYCAIATGRAPFMYEDIRKVLGIDSYVSFNGQFVVFEGTPVFKNPLNSEQLEQLSVKARESEHPLVYMNHQEMKATDAGQDFIQESLSSLHFDYPEIDPTFYKDREIYQSLLFCEGDEINRYRQAYPAFDYIRWHQFSCDVLPSGGSKANGIRKLVEAAGLSMDDTYAFGDGLNDIEMIRDAGIGVAMGNAVKETKEVSDMVTADVNEGGLVKAIYDLKLLERSKV
ncbi:Cof-type HAD-IIB family hydrolase [Halobacillus salinarum]|uniref:Cof-type HAD-IIB family hydrolase n=1 Tax=Halobacillus salinarum TaxID=2932257 RepID=A0ABY4EFE3_9BACI|nr:Cof-type HAD-IIB family hydrolase [Halobacillus salinarum]UOQ43194.1 Cof-type HAD-IIB family hydrolase [Halobacillus salinarum]